MSTTRRDHLLRLLKSAELVGIVVALGIVAIFGVAFTRHHFSPLQQHRRMLSRIQEHTSRVKTEIWALPKPSVSKRGKNPYAPDWLNLETRTRLEACGAIQTMLMNICSFPEQCDAPRLRAIADRLDRTQGEELSSAIGCLRLMRELEAVSSEVRDYAWFRAFRDKQAAGLVASLLD